VKNRSDIGILYWNASEDNNKRTEVGSMLKTPRYPVWLCIMGKNICVLFNTKIDLINNWRFELSFSLHVYTGLKKQDNEVKIQIGKNLCFFRRKFKSL
jgi:ubiquitin carboxyl-terminal hydrolase MINDY-3/4